MIAKVLIDNLTDGSLASEWGLCIFIQYNGHNILLDTGASQKFAANASEMGIDLGQIEFGVLSHAHYDHANGLAAFFERNDKAPFYLRNGAKENCYGRAWIFSKYVGIHKGFLETYASRIIYADGDYKIAEGIYLIPHKKDGLDILGKRAHLYIKQNNGIQIPDSFEHEQSLVFDTENGLVIFNSCSHGGADNIITEISETFPDKKIYALIGGFHLFGLPEKTVTELADRIDRTGIEKIYTGHCTGQKAFGILKEKLGERAEQLRTGMEIQI